MMKPPPMSDMDMGFEPQIRQRSNTWPLPRPEDYVEEPPSIKCEMVDGLDQKMLGGMGGPPGLNTGSTGAIKKNSSRRNAWGNHSYADLITQAINSSPEKRLTLSQIYEWMVQTIPYFKDKGDSNSSAGWKNSIRHNLSLHNRFMRVQNEGTGKSSWWMINPDAKPGKSARRRATSMETSKYERKRGRAKKKAEALRNGLDTTPSPSSSVSESLDLFPESPLPGFQLSPDFRARASSNASSSGRLTPIQSVETGDWSYYGPSPDQLAGSLESRMKIEPQPPPPPPSQYMYNAPPPYHQPQAPIIHPFNHCPHHPGHQVCNCHHLSAQNQYNSPVYSQPTQCSNSAPSTAIGQLMGALNSALIDDLNINIEETLEGTLAVEEVVQHELLVGDYSTPEEFFLSTAGPDQYTGGCVH